MVAWSSSEERLKTIERPGDTNKVKFSRIVRNYKDIIGKMVAALQDIFQEWFVMSWVVYFIGVTGNVTLVLKALFQACSAPIHTAHGSTLHIWSMTLLLFLSLTFVVG